jgi:hypothetical protein
LETGIRELARHNPRETKRLLNSALLRGRAAADNPDLCEKYKESLLFAQGVQLFLVQRIIQNWISNGRNLLREDESVKWFEDWSQAACKFPEFKPLTRETADDAAKLSKEKEQPQSDAEKAYEELKKVRLIGDDLKAVDKLLLLENNLLWQLLRIPFSAEVAQSSPKLEETRPVPVVLQPSKVQTGNVPEDLVSTLPSVIRDRIAKELKKPVAQLSSTDLGEVTSLDLSEAEISASDLAHLPKLSALHFIKLGGGQLTDASLPHLVTLSAAKGFDFRAINITNADWDRLAKVPHIEHLNLGGTQTSDEMLARVAEITSISELYLGRNAITDKGLEYLEKLEALTTLSLSETQITDTGLETVVKHHHRLKYLFLDNTPVTEAALVLHLPKLKSLLVVWMRNLKMSKNTLAQLKKQMPKTKFNTESDE